MERFLAALTFEVRVNARHDHFDRQFRIISAEHLGAALVKAKDQGTKESCTFTGEHGCSVDWDFVAVSDVQSLPEGDGLLWSESVNVQDTEDFRRVEKQRERHLRSKSFTLI